MSAERPHRFPPPPPPPPRDPPGGEPAGAGDFDPYYKWLGIPAREQPPNHYRLLGLELFESSPDVIQAAVDRQTLHLRTYALGKHQSQSQALLNHVHQAKACLLDPAAKAAYDAQLRARLAPDDPSWPSIAVVPSRAGTRKPAGQGLARALLPVIAVAVLAGAALWWRTQPKGQVAVEPRPAAPAPAAVERIATRPATDSPGAAESAPSPAETSPPEATAADVAPPPAMAERPAASAGAGPANPIAEQPPGPQPESESAAGVAAPGPPAVNVPPAVAPFNAQKAQQHQSAWAAALGVPVHKTNSLDMKLALIPAGEFRSGSSHAADQEVSILKRYSSGLKSSSLRDEYPVHAVRITRAFYLGQCEVTVGQFRRFVDEVNYRTECERGEPARGGLGFNAETGVVERKEIFSWRDAGFLQTEEHPVVNVSWNDAAAFCEWLGRKEDQTYRLPTEAEWEYACRAGTTTRFYFGEEPEKMSAAGNVLDVLGKAQIKTTRTAESLAGSDGQAFTAAVGSYAPNAFGLFDMYGNVSEWCADWHSLSYYGNSPAADPPGPETGARRVVRGGAWSQSVRNARSASRSEHSPGDCSCAYGFRVVCAIGGNPRPAAESQPPAVAGSQPPPAEPLAPAVAAAPSTEPAAPPAPKLAVLAEQYVGEATPRWVPAPAAAKVAARRKETLNRRQEIGWADLVRGVFAVSGEATEGSAPRPAARPSAVADRFLLRGELVGVRVRGKRGVVYLAESAKELRRHLDDVSTSSTFRRAAIEMDCGELAQWMADYRLGDKIRVAVRREAGREPDASGDTYVPTVLRSAGPLLAEFAPLLSSSSSTLCWRFRGEGLEKVGRPETWIDPELGRTFRLANAEAVMAAPSFGLRDPGSASAGEVVWRGKLEGLYRSRSRLLLRMMLPESAEREFPCLVDLGTLVEQSEFLDYLPGATIDVQLRPTGHFRPISSTSSGSQLRFEHSTSLPRGYKEEQCLPDWSGVQAEGLCVQVSGKLSSSVTSSGSRRSLPVPSVITPDAAYALSAAAAGKSVRWEALLDDVRRLDGETHLLFKLGPSLLTLSHFEALTKDRTLLADLGDYQTARASGKEGEPVIVSGVLISGGSTRYHFSTDNMLLDLQGIERPGRPEMKIVVGQRRRSPPPSPLRPGTLLSLLYDLPPAGTTVTFVAAYRHCLGTKVYVSADDQFRFEASVTIPGATKSQFADYKLGQRVEITATMPELPTSLTNQLNFPGKSIRKLGQ